MTKKGFIDRWIEKLDKKLEKKANDKKCCCCGEDDACGEDK